MRFFFLLLGTEVSHTDKTRSTLPIILPERKSKYSWDSTFTQVARFQAPTVLGGRTNVQVFQVGRRPGCRRGRPLLSRPIGRAARGVKTWPRVTDPTTRRHQLHQPTNHSNCDILSKRVMCSLAVALIKSFLLLFTYTDCSCYRERVVSVIFIMWAGLIYLYTPRYGLIYS